MAAISLILPYAPTGSTITAKVSSGSALAGTVTCGETPGGSNRFVGTFNAPASAASYDVAFYDGASKFKGSGKFQTDASGAEIELSTLNSAIGTLNPSAPPGAFTQTLTITNASVAPIEGAVVRYAQAGVTKDTATSNGSGVALIAVLAGTYQRTIFAGGFYAVTDVVTVSADAALPIALTALTEGINVPPGLAN